jgi:hypothetical protein
MKASIPSFGINPCGLFSIKAVLPVLSRTVRLADLRRLVVRAVMVLLFCFDASAIEPARAAESVANVDAARLVGADQDPIRSGALPVRPARSHACRRGVARVATSRLPGTHTARAATHAGYFLTTARA